MKKILATLFAIGLLASANNAFAQAQYSAFTKLFLKKIDESTAILRKHGGELVLSEEIQKDFLVRKTPEHYVIHGVLLVDAGLNEASLAALNVKVNSRIGNIRTAEIPVTALKALGEVSGVKYIEISSPVATKLDSARSETRVDLVQLGSGLPQAYTGNGVVVGVIDGGFDLTHPTFKDAVGNLRISRVWDQTATSGTKPDSFTYGAEYVGSAAILNAKKTGDGSHGTHVAGIAGGTGNVPNNQYRGGAPGAELVLVQYAGGTVATIEAAKYIFDYAASAGKPAVINMSLGTHLGPHDGTSLLDQAFDILAGNGKILVGAAGNEGNTPLHLAHNFTGDTIATFIDYDNPEQKGFLDMLGALNSSFSASVWMYNRFGAILAKSSFGFSKNSEVVAEYLFHGTDTVDVEIATTDRFNTNQRPRILVYVQNKSQNFVALVLTSPSSLVHVWNHSTGIGAALVKGTGFEGPPFVSGDNDYTVGEIGGTGKSVIAVGAYTTKNTYINSSGEIVTTIPFPAAIGEIAPFSSRGPTLDGRIKPDIAAPGNVVVSAISAFDPDFSETGSSFAELVINAANTTTGKYGALQGTSMAAPGITGVIALMLEANPNLNPDQIKTIFAQTARTDGFTGTIPPEGSNIWGAGKVDALAAVQTIVTSVASDRRSVPKEFSLTQSYPNPFNPETTIKYQLPKRSEVKLMIFDLNGRRVATLESGFKEAGEHVVRWNGLDVDGKRVASGVYLYRLEATSSNGVATALTKKLTMLK